MTYWLMSIVADATDVQNSLDYIAGKYPRNWLAAFDVEAHHGRGSITTTDDPARARRFPTFEAVMECWRTQSMTHPWRGDGRPNRPLTAYTIEPQRIDE